ncbi:uncharacterized protein PHALS_14485 [Plasmopara halstedii]|uniref:Uncharacterized protein n=1 Tax=Plasmopara halstedii TaxID=4781 RepID=A0A0P1ASB6_PLAHL|nr:uncharacterized protein PHALS_14485 [Plasmopara halstedii]CEG44226.1 hypothetical protein PHALS_14485 [Plasmopara halstedii]|eukprot:XP_024580595.1 hypothetical protein PHALS_14485 [Plasmopara halstedii]
MNCKPPDSHGGVYSTSPLYSQVGELATPSLAPVSRNYFLIDQTLPLRHGEDFPRLRMRSLHQNKDDRALEFAL